MGAIIRYQHHNWSVAVDEDLKGTHRKHCLCFRCGRFAPNQAHNCPTEQALYRLCEQYGLTTSVFECPTYLDGEPDLSAMEE